MEVVPEPSSSAPGAGRKGRRLVESWCAEMMTVEADEEEEDEGEKRAMMEFWPQGWANSVMVMLARFVGFSATIYHPSNTLKRQPRTIGQGKRREGRRGRTNGA